MRTFYPPDKTLPMVAPRDIGEVAAGLLTASTDTNECLYVEGPARYSSNDVAAAFAAAVGRPVRVVEIPESQWIDALQKMGFSIEAALSFANMTRITRDSEFPDPASTAHGETTLRDYIAALVKH